MALSFSLTVVLDLLRIPSVVWILFASTALSSSILDPFWSSSSPVFSSTFPSVLLSERRTAISRLSAAISSYPQVTAQY